MKKVVEEDEKGSKQMTQMYLNLSAVCNKIYTFENLAKHFKVKPKRTSTRLPRSKDSKLSRNMSSIIRPRAERSLKSRQSSEMYCHRTPNSSFSGNDFNEEKKCYKVVDS